MQQDAEEFYNTAIRELSRGLSSLNNGASMNSFLTFDIEEIITCNEEASEPPVYHNETMNKLVCNIQGGPGSTISVDHMHEGIKMGLEGSVEKYSNILGRNALWTKKQKLNSLPKYLCVQFMRFFWKPTPESMDHAGVKCKILRSVSYPEVYFLVLSMFYIY
jgi:ubiquitin carboxyl-terminal hydrolase 14